MIENIRPAPEMEWTQGINWARNTYDSAGEYVKEEPGIVRIGIDKTFYILEETPQHNTILHQGESPLAEGRTVVCVGYTGRPSLKAIAKSDQPFSLNDTERINAAAKVTLEMSQAYITWHANLEIRKNVDTFLTTMRRVIPKTDINTSELLAILENRLISYTERDYPKEFLRLADRIDELGIALIDEFGPYVRGSGIVGNWSPEDIRKLFGSMGQENVA